jgi:hypothetical protein
MAGRRDAARRLRPEMKTMALTAEKEYKYIGATHGCADHDHDLIHELSRRLDGLWRYDQYIANSSDRPHVREFRETVKQQDEDNVARLKDLVAREVKVGCF